MSRQIVICVQRRYQPNPVCCANHGSRELVPLLKQSIATQGLDVEVVTSGCMGMCQQGPNLRVMPGGRLWQRVWPEQVSEIVRLAAE